MDKLIDIIKKRMCYDESLFWTWLLRVVQVWKIFFYVLMPILVLWAASNSYIAVANQLKIAEQLDRIEAQETKQPNEGKQ